jgi:SAM-dependent methyltransferase
MLVKKILDLGCGSEMGHRALSPKNNDEEVIKVDIKGPYADVHHDLNEYPYPFPDNEFDEIYLNHSEYYVEDKEKLMDEIHRIAKPNAKIAIRSIHFSRWDSKLRLAKYPYFINIDSFNQFKDRFKIKKIRLNYFLWHEDNTLWKKTLSTLINFFANINPKFCERVWCYFIGGFDEIVGELIVKEAI